nr:MAG TPA: hypothetical protein [Caudoviricetes sp.]
MEGCKLVKSNLNCHDTARNRASYKTSLLQRVVYSLVKLLPCVICDRNTVRINLCSLVINVQLQFPDVLSNLCGLCGKAGIRGVSQCLQLRLYRVKLLCNVRYYFIFRNCGEGFNLLSHSLHLTGKHAKLRCIVKRRAVYGGDTRNNRFTKH